MSGVTTSLTLTDPGGSRLWHLKYRFNRKESCIALVTEKAATSPEKCFEAVAVAWHKTNKSGRLTMQSASLPV
jgi:hypothetical protein